MVCCQFLIIFFKQFIKDFDGYKKYDKPKKNIFINEDDYEWVPIQL